MDELEMTKFRSFNAMFEFPRDKTPTRIQLYAGFVPDKDGRSMFVTELVARVIAHAFGRAGWTVTTPWWKPTKPDFDHRICKPEVQFNAFDLQLLNALKCNAALGERDGVSSIYLY